MVGTAEGAGKRSGIPTEQLMQFSVHMLSFEVRIILLFCTREVFDVNTKAKHFCINKTTHAVKHPKPLCLVLISFFFMEKLIY